VYSIIVTHCILLIILGSVYMTNDDLSESTTLFVFIFILIRPGYYFLVRKYRAWHGVKSVFFLQSSHQQQQAIKKLDKNSHVGQSIKCCGVGVGVAILHVL